MRSELTLKMELRLVLLNSVKNAFHLSELSLRLSPDDTMLLVNMTHWSKESLNVHTKNSKDTSVKTK